MEKKTSETTQRRTKERTTVERDAKTNVAYVMHALCMISSEVKRFLCDLRQRLFFHLLRMRQSEVESPFLEACSSQTVHVEGCGSNRRLIYSGTVPDRLERDGGSPAA
jgi:hypothetical protein